MAIIDVHSHLGWDEVFEHNFTGNCPLHAAVQSEDEPMVDPFVKKPKRVSRTRGMPSDPR